MNTTLLLLQVTLAGAPLPKLAVAQLQGGDGTTPGMVKIVGEAMASELRRRKSFQVLTHDELQTLLSHEQLEQLLGCGDATCYARIGNAAGAQALAFGSLGRVGQSWIVTLKIIEVARARVVAVADRRIKDGTVDDLLDQLPGMAGELVEGAVAQMKATEPASAVVTTAPLVAERQALPQAGADRPYAGPLTPAQLTFLTDGKGHLVAVNPAGRYDGPIFAGDAGGLYEQRLASGGSNGAKWSAGFWDPRVQDGWRRSLDCSAEGCKLQCGDQAISLTPVDARTGKALAREAKLLAPRWLRAAIHLARDDTGVYYLIDQAREPRNNTDYRLFVGGKGSLEHQPLRDAIIDRQSEIFISDRGRLIIRRGPEQATAAWAVGSGEQPLTLMDLWQQAPMIYTTLGVYSGQRLGTACDPYLGR